MKLTRLAALTLVCCATSAQASEWWLLNTTGRKPNRSVLFVDESSIVEDANHNKQFWQFTFFETPDAGFKFAKFTKTRSSISCSQRTIGVLTVIEYQRDGTLIGSQVTDPLSIRMADIVPDSIGETFFNHFCAGKAAFMQVPEGNTPQIIAQATLDVMDKNGLSQ